MEDINAIQNLFGMAVIKAQRREKGDEIDVAGRCMSVMDKICNNKYLNFQPIYATHIRGQSS